MKYYKFHIGDYRSHAGYLTRMQDLVYRRLLDLYYMRERPLPAEPAECARLINMSDCLEDVQAVLKDFFVLDEDGYRNKRCDEEIDELVEKHEKKRRAGIASGRARRFRAELLKRGMPDPGRASQSNTTTHAGRMQDIHSAEEANKTNICSTSVEPPTTHNPLPITQNPISPHAPSCSLDAPAPRGSPVDNSDITDESVSIALAPAASHPPVARSAPPSVDHGVIAVPVQGGGEFAVDDEQLMAWQQAYPAVDVLQQLRHMRQWCLANPRRCKTRRGVRAFITGWLAREQDRGPPARNAVNAGASRSSMGSENREAMLARLENSRLCTVNQLSFQEGVDKDGRIIL